MHKNKFPLFGNKPSKTPTNKDKVISSLWSVCSRFSCLFISCQTGEGDPDNFFCHENHPYLLGSLMVYCTVATNLPRWTALRIMVQVSRQLQILKWSYLMEQLLCMCWIQPIAELSLTIPKMSFCHLFSPISANLKELILYGMSTSKTHWSHSSRFRGALTFKGVSDQIHLYQETGNPSYGLIKTNLSCWAV